MSFAGMGAAVELMGWGEARFEAIERQARTLFAHAVAIGAGHQAATPRLFGGFAFRNDFVPDVTWTGFNPGHFILPHIQLVHDGDASWLTINALVDQNEDVEESAGELQEALDAWYEELLAWSPQKESIPTGPDEVNYPMDLPAWTAMIEQALARCATSPLEKVVLARVCEVVRAARIEIVPALERLLERYPECYTFLFEPRPHHAFFGATPELLVQVDGAHFESMGLAGSIQRGDTAQADAQLAQALLNSSKDRIEHDLVVEAMRARLKPVAHQLEMPATPEIYRLSNIQHLLTPVSGTLAAPRGVLPLVDLLHPTPALGGAPRELALPFIREAEPVPRGWYAAPVGWINSQLDGSFGVAIRSAVVQDRRAWLYAGAGIVPESKPEREWEETGWKFRPIQQALGMEQVASSCSHPSGGTP
jgi:menaquinone-specific isochorismate synthase